MLDPDAFLSTLEANGVGFFTGVPDSLLGPICATFETRIPYPRHIIAANEGGAVALAIGHHLGTGDVPLVYMQNSGLGNAVNPIVSLASRDVYSMPMILLIGWRGEPGVPDEPQHVLQGKITPDLLDTIDVPFTVLSVESDSANSEIAEVARVAREESRPTALLVRKGTFRSGGKNPNSGEGLDRETAIANLVRSVEPRAAIVATTGMISRELFEVRQRGNEGHSRDFLTVGGMGHASQIAMGIAVATRDRPVYCFDGDGAALMHMGAFAIVGTSKLDNFVHVVLNNGAHESVGGQPTVAQDVDLAAIAADCGYSFAQTVSSLDDIEVALAQARAAGGPAFLEVRVNLDRRPDVGRPTTTPLENKRALLEFLSTD